MSAPFNDRRANGDDGNEDDVGENGDGRKDGDGDDDDDDDDNDDHIDDVTILLISKASP